MQSKRCPKCGETKPVSAFSRDRSRSDGLVRLCKECCRTYKRAHYEAHREDIFAYQRAYREAHKEECYAQIQKRDTEALKASREVATRNGEPWTPAEDKVVITSERTMLEVAIELGRTTSSVRSRRNLLRRKAVTA